MQSIKMRSLRMHPRFGYNIQRDYDLWWFTPVAIVGCIIGIVFFSLINLASNGFDLTLSYTSDPAMVMNDKHWYLSWSWDKHLQPNCSDQNIPVGTNVFTSNLGFTYNLAAVWSADSLNASNCTEVGSLPYLAQPLTDCEVDNVNLILTKADQSNPGINTAWWSWDDSSAMATAHCTAATRGGPHVIQLTVGYKPIASRFRYIIQSNYNESSNMWWATRLLNLYWYSTLTALTQQLFGFAGADSFSPTPAWTKGGVTYTPSGITDDITRLDFFNATFFFLAASGQLVNQDIENVINSSLLFNNASTYPYSETLTEGLMFSRVMYSALLTDLGSNSSQNVLLNERLLRWILLHPDDTFRNDPKNPLNATRACARAEKPPGCYEHYGLISVIAGPNITLPNATILDDRHQSQFMNVSYDTWQPEMGRLRTNNNVTTISSQYACQIPLRKSFGNVILPLLVADLVFLQACWKILNIVALRWIEHKDKDNTAMWCIGCLKKKTNAEGHSAGEVEMDGLRIQPKKIRSTVQRPSHGRNGSYQSLGSDESGETVRPAETDETNTWHSNRAGGVQT